MHSAEVTIYTPAAQLRNPRALLQSMISDLRRSRELAWQLARRDIKAQYRQAALGLLWALILPLANAAVWIFMQGSGIVALHDTSLPYPLFVFTGTMLWAIFMDAVNAPLQVTAAARPMLAKINFPREALVVSGIYQTLFNALIKLVVLFGAMLFLGVAPGWGVLLFPVALVAIILAGTTLGMLLTPIGMLYTDIGKGLPLLLQFLMYLTPVVYTMPPGGWARLVFAVNPLTPLITTGRELLTGGTPTLLSGFVIVSLMTLALLGLAWVAYRVAMPILIERMSA